MIVRTIDKKLYRLHFIHDLDDRVRRRVTVVLHPVKKPTDRCAEHCAETSALAWAPSGRIVVGRSTCSNGDKRRGVKPDNFSYEIGRRIALGRALKNAAAQKHEDIGPATVGLIMRAYEHRPRPKSVQSEPPKAKAEPKLPLPSAATRQRRHSTKPVQVP